MVKKKKLYWFYLLFWKACRSKNSPNQNISSFNYVDLNATSDLQLLQSVTRGHPFHNIINHCHQDWHWWRKVWMAARKCCEARRSATAVFPYSTALLLTWVWLFPLPFPYWNVLWMTTVMPDHVRVSELWELWMDGNKIYFDCEDIKQRKWHMESF